MITISAIDENSIKVIMPRKIQQNDFIELSTTVDLLIQEHKTIKLLIDAHDFWGWESFAAFKNHLGFVKQHQSKVAKIALMTNKKWQKILASIVQLLLHPELKIFNTDEENQAKQWLDHK